MYICNGIVALLAVSYTHLDVYKRQDYHGIHTVTPRPVGAFTTHDEQIARLNDLAKARKSTFKRTT